MTSQLTSQRDRILEAAQRRSGIPYRINPPPDGVSTLDCSLFVKLTLEEAGIALPAGIRTAEQIRQASDPIDWDFVEPGDLLFFEGTYDAAGPAGADGRIASHVGFSLGKGTQRMWDCHASGESGPPGVGVTDISTDYWQPKLFQACRPRGFGSESGAGAEPTQVTYVVAEAGVRMRAQPSASADILVQNLGAGTSLSVVSDQIVEADGHRWRNLRTADGTIGWVAADLLRAAGDDGSSAPPPPTIFVVNSVGVRLRAKPSTSADILIESIGSAVSLTSVSDQLVDAEGHSWRNVRTPDGAVGWVAVEFLREPAAVDDGGLTDEADHYFGFAVLWPHIQVAAGKFGADAQVIAGIMYQESGFKNVRVHNDGTGHGLFGFDDNGLLPDFEQWSGIQVGRGQAAISIPPRPQMEYCARIIAAYTLQFGNAINAARVWHRGAGLWQDDRGQNYENLIRAHIQELFG
jgi:SH3-like domain-containing protein